jgi:flagellar hook assembly protein FlgD
VNWDGRDDSGNTVASGTYLYRMTAGGETRTRKMTLLK